MYTEELKFFTFSEGLIGPICPFVILTNIYPKYWFLNQRLSKQYSNDKYLYVKPKFSK